MKKNTRIILLSLYRTDAEPFVVSKTYFEVLLPTVSVSGLRSLLFQIEQQGYVSVLRTPKGNQWCLTNQGRQVVESLFPALIPKSDQWHLLAFITPPKSDPSFRYLRSLLVKHNWVSVSRGVYLWYGQVDPLIQHECMVSYASHVVIVEVGKWLIGDGERLLLQSDLVISTLATYSGISKDIDQLINQVSRLEDMTDREKSQYALCFDRFHDNLRQDFGFCERWYDAVSRPMFLLRRFQSVNQ